MDFETWSSRKKVVYFSGTRRRVATFQHNAGGGVTRMPLVRRLIVHMFGREPWPTSIRRGGGSRRGGGPPLRRRARKVACRRSGPPSRPGDDGRSGGGADRSQHHRALWRRAGLHHLRRQPDRFHLHVVQGERELVEPAARWRASS